MSLSDNTKKLQELIQSTPNPEDIPQNEINNRYQLFIDTITDHNHLYYVDAKPIISDKEYDDLFSYLVKFENTYPSLISSISPTQWLVGQLSDWFQKADHIVPLLSLENSYNADDLLEWEQRAKKIAEKQWINEWMYHLEPKFDGFSVEFIYKNWRFHQAITRGDGKIWEDITSNVLAIQSLPKYINILEELHFRGEIMMPKSQLEHINQERENKKLSPFSNTRNAAAWSIKLLDSWEVSKRGLIINIYEQLYWTRQNFEEIGLPTFNLPKEFRDTSDIHQVIKWCLDPQVKEFLDNQDIDFDWLVIKIFDIDWKGTEIRNILWETEHHPRWSIAYKFPAQQVASQIQSVSFQVWRTWIITPVANIDPVQLSWATISRVSLHNFDFVDTKEIKEKDYVWVQRSWEVIPYIVWVIKERRNGEEKSITPPKICPICSSPTNNIDIHYYCTNPLCPAQIREKIVHFASRDAMNIEGLWDSVVDTLVDQKILSSIVDLYELTPEKQLLLRRLPSFWEKKVFEITSQIEQSKHQPLWRILNAIWIPNVWKKIAQDLANYLKEKQVHCLDDMINIFSQEELKWLYWIWEKIWNWIIAYITNEDTLNILRKLEKHGINFDANNRMEKEKDIKWHFSITWTFPLSRNEIIKQLEKKGFQFDENPNKNTDFIFIWEDAWAKSEKARNLWIKIYEDWEIIQKEFWIEIPIISSKKQRITQWWLF